MDTAPEDAPTAFILIVSLAVALRRRSARLNP